MCTVICILHSAVCFLYFFPSCCFPALWLCFLSEHSSFSYYFLWYFLFHPLHFLQYLLFLLCCFRALQLRVSILRLVSFMRSSCFTTVCFILTSISPTVSFLILPFYVTSLAFILPTAPFVYVNISRMLLFVLLSFYFILPVPQFSLSSTCSSVASISWLWVISFLSAMFLLLLNVISAAILNLIFTVNKLIHKCIFSPAFVAFSPWSFLYHCSLHCRPWCGVSVNHP